MSKLALDRLKERFGDAITATHSRLGDDTAVVRREKILEILGFLRDDPELHFNMCSDLTCVDYFGRTPRFEVVYHLYSTVKKKRVRLKVELDEDDATIASSVSLWSGNNWLEREAFDMYGVRFEGHPNLQRLFMYGSFEGHALRKDYPKDKRQPLARREGLT
jgi:NADH-quinone oxidoreductase subunit C